MTATLTLFRRGLTTAHTILPNSGRSVSDMPDDQRRAVMAKIGGYSGSARGGGSPARRLNRQLRQIEADSELRRQGTTGLSSDLTPLDQVVGSLTEEALDAMMAKAEESGDNTALASVGLLGLAYGIGHIKSPTARKQAKEAFEAMLKQMDDDAVRMAGAVDEQNAIRLFEKARPASHVNPTVARSADDIAKENAQFERLVGYHPDKLPHSPAGNAFREEAARHGGSKRAELLDYAAQADLEAVAPRVAKDPWTSTADAIPKVMREKPVDPKRLRQASSRLDAERRFADGEQLYRVHEMDEKLMPVRNIGDLDGYAPDQIYFDPGPARASNPIPAAAKKRLTMEEAARLTPDMPAMELGFLSDKTVGELYASKMKEAAFYARQKARAVSAGKSIRPGETPALFDNKVHPDIRLISNAVREAAFITNAGMSDDQRKAFFARMKGSGGRFPAMGRSLGAPKMAPARSVRAASAPMTGPALKAPPMQAPKVAPSAQERAGTPDTSGMATADNDLTRSIARQNGRPVPGDPPPPAGFLPRPDDYYYWSPDKKEWLPRHMPRNTDGTIRAGATAVWDATSGQYVPYGQKTPTPIPGAPPRPVTILNPETGKYELATPGHPYYATHQIHQLEGGVHLAPGGDAFLPAAGSKTAKSQPSGPRQPRTDGAGRTFYGPTPGEPGYIDVERFRRGAQPGPGKPKPNPGEMDQAKQPVKAPASKAAIRNQINRAVQLAGVR